MSALATVFSRAQQEGRAALIGYLPAGFPSVDGAIEAMAAMVDGGVDVVEVGLPYSDPLLDGETIQQAVEAALTVGVTTDDVMRTVSSVSKTGAPTLVMSYWNPIERFGIERFAQALVQAGGAGTITADIIPEEATGWIDVCNAHRLDHVFLVAPSSTDARIASTAAATQGFVYAAAVMGVTGARSEVGAAARSLVERTKRITELPVCVGIGVSSGAQAAEIAEFADGVIVGSAFVRKLLDAPSPAAGVESVRALAEELAAGVRNPARRTLTRRRPETQTLAQQMLAELTPTAHRELRSRQRD